MMMTGWLVWGRGITVWQLSKMDKHVSGPQEGFPLEAHRLAIVSWMRSGVGDATNNDPGTMELGAMKPSKGAKGKKRNPGDCKNVNPGLDAFINA